MKIVYKVPVARPVTAHDTGFVYVVAEEGDVRGRYDAIWRACGRANRDTGIVQEMTYDSGDGEIGEWAPDGDEVATELAPSDHEEASDAARE